MKLLRLEGENCRTRGCCTARMQHLLLFCALVTSQAFASGKLLTVPLDPVNGWTGGSCTIYVSPTGSASVPGSTFGAPTTIGHAISIETAGSIVCFEAGTYNTTGLAPTASGTSSSPIVWIDYNWMQNGPAHSASGATIFWSGTTGSATGNFMIGYTAAYRAFVGLIMNGNNYANQGLICEAGGAGHYEYAFMQVTGVNYSGLNGSQCSDYYTYLYNWVWQNGENPHGINLNIQENAGSCITPNNVIAISGDTYTGLHGVIVGNMTSGCLDAPGQIDGASTDGEGIQLDLVRTQASAGGYLVANNVVWGNGGRCIEIGSGFYYPGNVYKNVVVFGNTCYYNMLDLNMAAGVPVSEFENNKSTNVYYIDNISVTWPGWNGTSNGPVENYYENTTTGTVWENDIWFQGVEGVSQSLINTDLKFLNPPVYDPSAGGQTGNSPSPAALGNGLQLQSSSPAIGAGIDPTTVAGISGTQIATDMAPYTSIDILGVPRPNTNHTLGAYEFVTTINPPSGLSVVVK
jgi:hypothetical protein